MPRTCQLPTCDLIGLASDFLEAEAVQREDSFKLAAEYANDCLVVLLHQVIGVSRSPYLPIRKVPWGRFDPFDGSLRDLRSPDCEGDAPPIPVNNALHDILERYTMLPSLQKDVEWIDIRRCHDLKPVVLL